ncbi:protein DETOXIFICATION 33-like [Dioscorea cayenensis subsp. rotundata]|uniref:Protein DETOXIFICATION n=1 Tax=Dioscorea cayennensis subsp. rotundata TaxID=55577 RepID=A0AB40BWV4_DIOCR|nr:protein DETOXIFICATION 33-like [Dioscorea cayenensis subsp. rotundata]
MASASSPLLAVRNEDEEEEMAVSSCWVDTRRELRLVWGIAGPAILTSVFQYTLGATTQTLTGHIGTLELAAVGIQNLVVSGIAFGIMVGMGSALETLCGQAFGAKKSNMLGVYLQRSWIILLITALILTLVYIFATPILKLLGQSDEIAELAGRFSIWMIPELFAFAINFPIQKFLQAQSKVWEMAWISAGCLILHLVLSWLFIIKLKTGLLGAAVTLNFSWWLLVAGQFGYVLSGYCKDSWTGFSWLAFKDLGAFFRLSVASAVMLCLEYWAFMIVIELAGLLKHPEKAVDAATICMNVEGWCFMVPLGLVAAISVRVSNELGAGNPKAAKFSLFVVTGISLIIQTTFVIIILVTREDFPKLFTEDELVRERVSNVAYYLCATIFLGSMQPVRSGVAIGAGWQTTVAYVDLGSYYAVGLTIALLLGFTFNLGLEGIWGGVIIGVALQTIILIIITWRTNWEKEVLLANDRVLIWGGSEVTTIQSEKV